MTLFEYFNTTNQTSPHFERHENFVSDVANIPCSVLQILPDSERCEFVQENIEECKRNNYIFDYVNLYYCQINTPWEAMNAAIGITILLLVLMFLFMILYISAETFFCPSLETLSKLLGLNENVAGVTLLAFGNTAPDTFTNFAGLNTEERIMYSDIFTNMCFVFLVVAGSIAAVVPFDVNSTIFLRDIGFLLLTVLYLSYSLGSEKKVSLAQTLSIILIYVIYIIVVITDQYLVKRVAKDLGRKMRRYSGSSDMSSVHAIFDQVSLGGSVARNRFGDMRDSIEEDEENAKAQTCLQQFMKSLNPINMQTWKQSNWFNRIMMIIAIPIRFPLNLLVPIVNSDLELHGWTRLLNSLHFVILPTFITYVVQGFPYYLYVLACTFPFGLALFIFTKTNTIPYVHRFFSLYGAFGSIFIIYSIAQEIISVLAVLGLTTYRSNSFLGSTLLAWGNSIGDLVTNIAMARQGYPKMGFAACFGSPLMSSLICIGCSYSYKVIVTGGPYSVPKGTLGPNAEFFTLVCFLLLILALLTTNFEMRRSIGLFMISIYCIYLTFAFLCEFEVVHPYGSDHRLDAKLEPAIL